MPDILHLLTKIQELKTPAKSVLSNHHQSPGRREQLSHTSSPGRQCEAGLPPSPSFLYSVPNMSLDVLDATLAGPQLPPVCRDLIILHKSRVASTNSPASHYEKTQLPGTLPLCLAYHPLDRCFSRSEPAAHLTLHLGIILEFHPTAPGKCGLTQTRGASLLPLFVGDADIPSGSQEWELILPTRPRAAKVELAFAKYPQAP